MLRALDDDLWSNDSSVRLMPGVHMPARMTVARLAEGVWLHSPIALDDETVAAISEIGPVTSIVAPNCLHHLHVGTALARFPEAKLYAPASLGAKRPDLRIDVALDESAVSPWSELAVVHVAGAPSIDEFVFVHRPSDTLIASDLLFNVHTAAGFGLPMVLRMVGAWRRLAQSKVWRRATKDRPAAAAAIERLLTHEIARVIPAHGDVLESPDAHAQVSEALRWMRDASA